MKYKLNLFLILISFTSFCQINQDDFLKDSLKIVKVKLIRPKVKFDNRINFYGSQSLPATGFDIGVLRAEKLRLTIGYYNMNNALKNEA